jgi:hypothetical protein
MIEAYSVGVTLKLHDLISVNLVRIAESMERLDRIAANLNKSLSSMGRHAAMFRNLEQSAKLFNTNLVSATHQASKLDSALLNIRANGVMPSVGSGIAGNLASANAEARMLRYNLSAIRGPGRIGSIGGGGGGGTNAPRASGHGGMHGGNIHAGPGGLGIGAVGVGIASEAMLPLAAGYIAYAGTKSVYNEAKKLEKSKADFGNMNLSKADNDSVLSKSWAITNTVRGTKVAENMALIQDLHTATGDLPHALEMSDAYAKFSVAAQMQNNGASVHGLVMDSIKALEHRGDRVMQDPAERDKELRMQSQVAFFTKGVVGPHDYFEMSKTGKLAYQLASPEYLYGPAAALISANTGATAGTMEMTALSSLVGGHMDKKGKNFLGELGLWNDKVDPSVAALRQKFNKSPEYQAIVAANGGNLIQPGGLSADNAKLFVADRNKFALEVLLPAIRKKYGLGIGNEEVASLLSANLNRNTSADLSFYATNQLKTAKDTKGIRNSKDYQGAYSSYMGTTPTGAEVAFEGAWSNFKTEFGKNVLPRITEMLLGGAEILRKIQGIQAGPSAPTFNPIIGGPGGYALQWAGKLLGIDGSAGPKISAYGGKDVTLSDLNGRGRPVPAAAAASTQPVILHMDGKKVGEGVMVHMNKSVMRQPTGPRMVDLNMGLPAVSSPIGNY